MEPSAAPNPSLAAPPWGGPGGAALCPPWLSVAYVGVIVAALAAGAVLTFVATSRLTYDIDAGVTRRLAHTIAAVLATCGESGDAREAVAALEPWPRVVSFTWVGPDNQPRLAWTRGSSAAVDPRTSAVVVPPLTPGAARCASEAPIHGVGGAVLGTLRLERDVVGAGAQSAAIAAVLALMICAPLVGFALYEREQRRRFRPYAAVSNVLEALVSDPSASSGMLRLSEALGPVAQSWNRVIEDLDESRRRAGGGGGGDASEAVLKRLESARYRQLIDHLPFGLLLADASLQIVYANAAATSVLPCGGEKLVGALLSDVVGTELIEPAVLAARGRPGAVQTVDHVVGDAKEPGAMLRLHVQALAGASTGANLLITVQDMTVLRESERARDNFLYHVTHELRTPLTNIHAYAETLSGPGFDDERTRAECYNVLISETERLARLVEDVLSISQLEVGSARMEISDVDLAKLMRQMVKDNLGAADSKQIDLNLALPPKLPKIRGDKQRLSVLLSNLIGNALKYTPERGKVQVRVEPAEGCVQIKVSDTGIGIAPSDLQHVFEKFYRAEDDRVRTIKGTGLGLALAQEVARLHGGEIRAESELGKGSTFTVELPCASSGAVEASTR